MSQPNQSGVLCASGCGRRVVPVQAEDCGSQSGPWYCVECFECECETGQRTPLKAFEARVKAATDAVCNFDPDAAAYRARTAAWVRLALTADDARDDFIASGPGAAVKPRWIIGRAACFASAFLPLSLARPFIDLIAGPRDNPAPWTDTQGERRS